MLSPSRFVQKLLRVPNDLQLYRLIETGRLDRSVAIACRDRPDGGGALVHSRLSAMCFAETARIRYLHTPFACVTHAEGDEAEWTRKWEAFFNLGLGEEMAGDRPTVDLKAFLDHPSRYRRTGLIISALHFSGLCNRYPDAYRKIIPRFREKYNASDKSRIPLNRIRNGVTVAVHIRRGDVAMTDPVTRARYTDDVKVLGALRELIPVLEELRLPVRILLYSEGKPEDFAAFAELGCELQIGGDAFETFHNLVESDVLIMAKSSFSFVAALLSDAIKLYEPCWNAPLSDWIAIEAGGGFDRSALRRQLLGKFG